MERRAFHVPFQSTLKRKKEKKKTTFGEITDKKILHQILRQHQLWIIIIYKILNTFAPKLRRFTIINIQVAK